jgi:hypothetical protein
VLGAVRMVHAFGNDKSTAFLALVFTSPHAGVNQSVAAAKITNMIN